MEFEEEERREYQVEAEMDEDAEYERLARELGYKDGEEMEQAERERAEQDRDYYSALGV